MSFLPVIVGIENADGTRADAKRADGTRGPIMLRLGEGLGASSEVDGGITRVTLVGQPPTDSALGWKKSVVRYTDIAAAALTTDVEFGTLAIKGCLHQLVIKTSVAFAGGSVSAVKASLGITGDLTKYSGPELEDLYDCFAAPGDADVINHIDAIESFVAATSLRVKFTSVGGNLSTLTAGTLEIWHRATVLP